MLALVCRYCNLFLHSKVYKNIALISYNLCAVMLSHNFKLSYFQPLQHNNSNLIIYPYTTNSYLFSIYLLHFKSLISILLLQIHRFSLISILHSFHFCLLLFTTILIQNFYCFTTNSIIFSLFFTTNPIQKLA